MTKILIVDDDEFAQDYHINGLSGEYEIDTANNGEEALNKVPQFQPDLILMDIQMPKLNGYDTATALRDKGNQVPILFLSQLTSLEERLKAYDSGGNDFIAKPAEPVELKRKIQSLLTNPYIQQSQEAKMAAARAMSELSSLGHIIRFFTNSYLSQDFEQLATAIFKVTETFGLHCSLVFRNESNQEYFFDDGLEKGIDTALLESLQGARRIMEFGNSRAAFNWRLCSLLVKNMPDDMAECGEMKDYLAYLMDGVEQVAAKILLETKLRRTVKRFSEQNETIKLGIVDIIDDLERNLEDLFSALNVDGELSESTEQALLSMIESARSRADDKLESGRGVGEELNQLLVLFESDDQEAETEEVELF